MSTRTKGAHALALLIGACAAAHVFAQGSPGGQGPSAAPIEHADWSRNEHWLCPCAKLSLRQRA